MNFKIAPSLIFVCLATASITQSQVYAQAQIQVQQVQVQQNIGGPLGADPIEMEASMRIEIDAIRRLTGLSDAGAKKLEVAAMAAVKNAVKKSQEMKLAVPGFPGGNPQPIPGNTLSDEDEENSEKEPKNLGDQPIAPPAFPMLDIKKVKEEAIWTKTLASVLSSEQMAKYEDFLADRLKRKRTAAVETKVNQMDEQLSFTLEQRTSVTELIDRKHGDELAKLQAPAGVFGGGVQVIVMMAGQQNTELAIEDLKPILSEVQLAEFKRRQEIAAQGPLGALQRVLPPVVNAQLGINPPAQSSLGFTYVEKDQGIEVVSVEEGSVASKTGLQVGDVIDAFQGIPIDTAIQLKRAIGKRGKEPVTIRVKRAGQVIVLEGTEAK